MKGGDASQAVVFDHCMDCVNAYFFDMDKRAWDTLSAPECAELKSLWDGFNVQKKEVVDFTLPMYFRQLYMAGRSVQEITEKITWWNEREKKVSAARAASKDKVYKPRMFRLQKGSCPAGLLHVEDYFEAEEAPYALFGDKKLMLSLLILRDEEGHVHIKSSFRYPGMNFDALFDALNTVEPGLWYLEKRFKAGPMIMNGSRQFTGVPPTGLSDDDIVLSVYALATCGKKQ